MYSQTERNILHKVAEDSILSGLERQSALSIKLSDYPEALQKKQASFVTLNIKHNLRGCIGTLSAYQALVEDIAHNAYAAAFSDPRFPALTQREYQQLDYHISVLSDSCPMQFSCEEDLLAQIRPQIDGLIVEDNGRRGTFLPSVWEQLPATGDFWQHLKRKAGLAADHWSDTLKVSRYTVESF